MNIGIVGLGLIGGSLGLDLRKAHHTIYGMSRSARTCELAVQRGIADVADCHPQILERADVVILCPPIGLIESVFDQVQPYLSPKAIVSDVGSVKGAIAPLLHQRWPRFIGGHPMAGTAESGIEAAQSDLFQGRPYVLTPLEDSDPVAVETLKALVQDLGATLFLASPRDHDRAVSLISHLPIMVSAALIAAAMDSDNQGVLQLAQSLASSGFCDTSRVGGGNPELGRMVAQFNREELLRSLDLYEHHLQQLRRLITLGEWENLEHSLHHTQTARPHFLES